METNLLLVLPPPTHRVLEIEKQVNLYHKDALARSRIQDFQQNNYLLSSTSKGMGGEKEKGSAWGGGRELKETEI